MSTLPTFKIWKAIMAGGTSKEELLARMRAAEVSHTRWAEDLLHWTHFFPYSERRQVNFGRLSLEEMGLRPGHTTEDAAERALSMGIELGLFIPSFAFELGIACARDRNPSTLVIPLSQLSQYSAMYVNPTCAGYRQSIRADQNPTKLEEGDSIIFVLPE